MSDLQDRIAKAMGTKRAELIHQPLARIWPDLALAAIQEYRSPNELTRATLAEMRCAECTCEKGGADCNWIAAARPRG